MIAQVIPVMWLVLFNVLDELVDELAFGSVPLLLEDGFGLVDVSLPGLPLLDEEDEGGGLTTLESLGFGDGEGVDGFGEGDGDGVWGSFTLATMTKYVGERLSSSTVLPPWETVRDSVLMEPACVNLTHRFWLTENHSKWIESIWAWLGMRFNLYLYRRTALNVGAMVLPFNPIISNEK